jgi:hypothetical protein
MNKSYNNLEIRSLYGIDGRTTDKMVLHLPFELFPPSYYDSWSTNLYLSYMNS